MANASDLPTEIWLLIARYLPKSELSQLKSLNGFFFNCWMDMTWKQVMIDTEFPHRAVRLLSRMADPFVSTRTKRLTVCLRHFKAKELPFPASSKSTFSKLTSILLPKPKSQITVPTFQSAISLFLQTLPLLPNITNLVIELWHIPLGLLPSLFQTITTSPLENTLQKLWLSGHVDLFASLAKYSTCERKIESCFQNLTELYLELINHQLLPDSDDDLALAIDTPSNSFRLAHFILSLPSLQLLRIWNWSTTLDLSLLFSHLSEPLPDSPSLVPLPNLRSLILILPFNTSLESSPQFLHRFLLIHSNTLQHLQLRLKMSRIQLDPDMEEPLGTWLADLVNSVPQDSATKCSSFFPNLKTLDIYPSTTSAGLSALLVIIKRTAPTLSSLTIRDRYLTREETHQVLDVLTEGQGEARNGVPAQIPPLPTTLKSLRMNITHLSVSFLDLLARKLPQLQNLWLSVSEIVGSDELSFHELLHSDSLSVQDDYLTRWKLRDLAIWQAGQEMDDVVRAVALVVPSIVLGGGDDGLSDER